MAVDHQARLKANEDNSAVAVILNNYNPILQSYKSTDVNLLIALGQYKGSTQTVEELFTQLRKVELPAWEVQIYTKFAKGSAQATALLPRYRAPLNSGTYASRIQEIKTLGDKCANIIDLQILSSAILAFHTQIESARQLQQSTGEGRVANLRALREAARVRICQVMYGNLGALMQIYRDNPRLVAMYFDIALLRGKKVKTTLLMASGTIRNAQTGLPIAMAQVKFTLPKNVVMSVETDANGQFNMELGRYKSSIEAIVEITAKNYHPFNESGTINVTDDLKVEVDLEPIDAEV